jgi:hypothetical protein
MNGVFMNRSCRLWDARHMSARLNPFFRRWRVRPAPIGAALGCALLAGAVAAQEGRGALADAVRSGQILPLAHFSDHAERHFGGRLIEVELDREKQGLRYELELLLEDGRKLELVYDAASGGLLEVEGHRLETVFGRQGRPYP